MWRDNRSPATISRFATTSAGTTATAAKKLDKRVGFLRDGRLVKMWRTDIVRGSLRSAISTGPAFRRLTETVAPEAVATDWKQPQAGAYEAELAEAHKVEDALEREALATALEGEIIPPTPIGKGPLAQVLMASKLNSA